MSIAPFFCVKSDHGADGRAVAGEARSAVTAGATVQFEPVLDQFPFKLGEKAIGV
jgi:hypothetical protein